MNQKIRAAYNNCKPEESLPFGDGRYVDFSERNLRGSDDAFVDSILNRLTLEDGPTRVLASGFRGCGKTTELYILQHELEKMGYWVVYVDVEDYLNLHVPATVSDLWLTIAGGFDAFLDRHAAFAAGARRWWDRITSFLNREVDVSDVTFKAGSEGPLALGAEFKIALKENADFRTRLNERLEAKRPDFVRECRAFVEEAIGMLAAKRTSPGCILILDTFEKLQGDYRNADDVRRSAEQLFIRDWGLLDIPCRSVLTVPPWLAFVEAGANAELGRTHLLSMCKVAERDGRTCRAGEDALLDLLGKRMDVEELFGDRERLRPLVQACGGYPRDLLRMIREVLERNARVAALPLSAEKLASDIDRVVERLVEQYALSLSGEDLPLLARIAVDKGVEGWPRNDKFRIAELFDHHIVMAYQNGQRWFNLHPLVARSGFVRKAVSQARGSRSSSPAG